MQAHRAQLVAYEAALVVQLDEELVHLHCGLLDRPPPVDRYRPSDPQYQFIWTRDRRCRQPGCTIRAAWADLDHVLPQAHGGATSCENLCCLCRRHHPPTGHDHRPHHTNNSPSGSPSGTRTTAPAARK